MWYQLNMRGKMIPPGLEPGTLRVLGARDNHYTTESTCMRREVLDVRCRHKTKKVAKQCIFGAFCLHSFYPPLPLQPSLRIMKHLWKKCYQKFVKIREGAPGFEPGTSRSAVECSTTELCPHVRRKTIYFHLLKKDIRNYSEKWYLWNFRDVFVLVLSLYAVGYKIINKGNKLS